MVSIPCMLTGIDIQLDCLGIFLRRRSDEAAWEPASYPFKAYWEWHSSQLETEDQVLQRAVAEALAGGRIRPSSTLDSFTLEGLTNALLGDEPGSRSQLLEQQLNFAVICESVVVEYMKSRPLLLTRSDLEEGLSLFHPKVPSRRQRTLSQQLYAVAALLDVCAARWEPAKRIEDDPERWMRDAVLRFRDIPAVLEGLTEVVREFDDESMTKEALLEIVDAGEVIFER